MRIEIRRAREDFQTNVLDALEELGFARQKVAVMGMAGEEPMLLLAMIGTARSALDALRVIAPGTPRS